MAERAHVLKILTQEFYLSMHICRQARSVLNSVNFIKNKNIGRLQQGENAPVAGSLRQSIFSDGTLTHPDLAPVDFKKS
jgi:hypothetical protein